jgi:hypothetical protein
MPYYKPMDFTTVYKDTAPVEVSHDGLINIIDLLRVPNDMTFKEAQRVILNKEYDTWQYRAGRSYLNYRPPNWIKRTIKDQIYIYLTMEEAVKFIQVCCWFGGEGHRMRQVRMQKMIEDYMQEMPTMPEPPPAVEEPAKKRLCTLHNKRNTVCTGCLKLHKQDPKTYPCPSDFCEDCYKRKHRCTCDK